MMRTMLQSKTRERSSPETLHDILTCPDVKSSGYFEDTFKVVLSFVKKRRVCPQVRGTEAARIGGYLG